MNEKVVNRRLKNSQRGVTLIALVLSIVAMVIMAGASVSVITGDDGLMAKAVRAENQKKMGEYEEKIKLAAINAKSEMNLEGNIKEKFIEKLEDMGFTVITPEDDAELQANQIKVRTEDGFEFIYSINDSADIELLDQRINGKPYATLTLEQVGMEGTANEAIKIRATTSIVEGGQITLLECLEIQTDNPEDKTGKVENPASVVEFTVPSSGTYTVRTTTNEGNTTTKRITIAINTISNKITITPSTTSPRNTGEAGEQNGIAKGPVTLTISFEETELTKQYKKYGDENWTNVTGTSKTISVTANETYVARYYDGKNGYNQETYNVVNVDNVAPTFTASNVVAIAEGVNVTFTITEPATDEASANASNTTAGILRYEYRLEDGTTGSTEPTVLTKTLTSSKLGEQKVYVKAIDKAGNETEVEKTVTVTVANTTITMSMTDPADETKARNTTGSGTVNGVAQGPITVTINFGVTNLQKQYKVGENGSWVTTNENTVTLNDITENGPIVAKYWDGTNSSQVQTYNVINVDNVAPTFTAQDISTEVNDLQITVSIDNEATDTASTGAATGGTHPIPGILRYEYSLDGTNYSTNNVLTASTWGTHTVYVKAIDKAGNQTVVQKEASVVADFNAIQMTPSTTDPAQEVSLTINFGNTALQKQYALYSENLNWINVNDSQVTISNITSNVTYVARYYDGERGTSVQTYSIVNVDNQAPTFTSNNITATVNDTTITVTANGTDTANTGALSTIAGIARYEYKLDNGSYGSSNVLTAPTIGDHTVYVKAIDKAGNETIAQKVANVDIASSGISMSASPTTARNTGTTGTQNGVDKGPITLTINYGTTNFTKQYKKQGDSNWTTVNGNSVQVSVTENCSYVARYFDGTTGRETSAYGITNVDNVAPTFPAENLTVTANSQGTITVSITAATDTASTGAANNIAGISKYEYKLGTRSYGIGATNLSTSKEFTVTESGTYTVYVKAIDKAGNETERSKTVNVSTIIQNISSAISSASQYGEYINLGTNLLPNRASSEKTDWRILYKDTSDGNKVYAILTDYLPNSNGIASSVGLTYGTGGDATYGVKGSNQSDLVNKLGVQTAWKTGLFNGSGLASNSKYASVTARGGVTADTILASYNAKYNASLKTTTTPIQYFYKNNNSSEGYDDLYVRALKNNCYGYYLASPLEGNSRTVWGVSNGGYLNTYSCSITFVGVRPAVLLPSDLQVYKDANGVWQIYNPISEAITSASQYGEYINLGTNLLPNRTSSEKTDWRILYKDTSDGNKVYAILTDYLPNSNGIAGSVGLSTYSTYGVYGSGSSELKNKLRVQNEWKTGLFSGSGLASNSKYASVTAGGGVNPETLIASYNAKYNTSKKISSGTYFYINNNSSEGNDNLYVRAVKSGCYGCWLAETASGGLWHVYYEGNLTNFYSAANTDYGIRPAVILPSDLQVYKDANGVWQI